MSAPAVRTHVCTGRTDTEVSVSVRSDACDSVIVVARGALRMRSRIPCPCTDAVAAARSSRSRELLAGLTAPRNRNPVNC